MRYLLIFFLLILIEPCYSQFFVGDTKETVKSALQKKNIKFTESKVTDTTNRISWLVENEYQVIWVLDLHDSVIRQTIIPEKENGANELVKWFNRDFVVISPAEWRNYADGRIYKIQLEYILRESLFSVTLIPRPK